MALSPYLQMIIALLFVLALMGLLGFALKRFGLGGPLPQPGTKRRLQMVEALSLSPHHRAVILKRDETEHLVILGPNGETVVETGITPPHPVQD